MVEFLVLIPPAVLLRMVPVLMVIDAVAVTDEAYVDEEALVLEIQEEEEVHLHLLCIHHMATKEEHPSKILSIEAEEGGIRYYRQQETSNIRWVGPLEVHVLVVLVDSYHYYCRHNGMAVQTEVVHDYCYRRRDGETSFRNRKGTELKNYYDAILSRHFHFPHVDD